MIVGEGDGSGHDLMTQHLRDRISMGLDEKDEIVRRTALTYKHSLYGDFDKTRLLLARRDGPSAAKSNSTDASEGEPTSPQGAEKLMTIEQLNKVAEAIQEQHGKFSEEL